RNHDITAQQYAEAIAHRKLGLHAGHLYTRIREPYFFTFVREQLITKYGADRIRAGGLRVYTTIDPRLQRAARQAITDTLYHPDPYTPAWDVTTYDHTYLGGTTIENATLHSDNTVFAQLTLDVGPEKVAEMAHRLGVQSPLTTKEGAYVPSLGLGAIAVSPLDLASAYSTLAAGGIYSKPMAIRKVVLGNGKEDTDAGWGEPSRTRVISPG